MKDVKRNKKVKYVISLIVLLLLATFLSICSLFCLLVTMFEGIGWFIGVAIFAVPLIFVVKKIIKIKNVFKQCSKTSNTSLKDILLNCELVQASDHNATCEICSIYQNRVYSVNGKDKRFPKLPKEFIEYGGFHPGCRHTLYPFFYFEGCVLYDYVLDESTGEYKQVRFDAIEYSNRPFIDSRTNEQIKLYENYKKRMKLISILKENNPSKPNHSKQQETVKEIEPDTDELLGQLSGFIAKCNRKPIDDPYDDEPFE